MNIVIAGGHGKVALRLTRLLRERGDRVISLIRNPAHAADAAQAGGEPKLCDLEFADEHAVERAIAGGQAIVFAAGAGSGSGPERKWTVDYGAAVRALPRVARPRVSRGACHAVPPAGPQPRGTLRPRRRAV
jgi:nucleoside-diphosphate-sugar epimerase